MSCLYLSVKTDYLGSTRVVVSCQVPSIRVRHDLLVLISRPPHTVISSIVWRTLRSPGRSGSRQCVPVEGMKASTELSLPNPPARISAEYYLELVLIWGRSCYINLPLWVTQPTCSCCWGLSYCCRRCCSGSSSSRCYCQIANVIELRYVCNGSWCLRRLGFSQLSNFGPGVSWGVVAKDSVKTSAIISSCKIKNTIRVWVKESEMFPLFTNNVNWILNSRCCSGLRSGKRCSKRPLRIEINLGWREKSSISSAGNNQSLKQ